MAKALADLEALLREIPSAAAERPLAALNQLDSNAVGTSSGTDVASGAETTEELRARSLSRRSTEWQPSPLTGLPIEALVEVAVAPLIRMAHAGRLSAPDARRLTSGDILDECEVLGEIGLEFRDPLMRVLRHVWTRDVAWALFTTEWVDSVVRLLHRIVHGPAGEAQHAPRKAIRVVEVAAGSGLLATAMRAKGIDWSSSDSAKMTAQLVADDCAKARDDDGAHGGCEQMTALETLVEIEASQAPRPDVVFWSWWSRSEAHDANVGGYTSEERACAEHCHRLNIPIVFVGEPVNGITGGLQYWKDVPWTTVHARDLYVDEMKEPFVDVSQWRGFNDCTWVQQRTT